MFSPKDVNPSECICVSAKQIPADIQSGYREAQAREYNKFMIHLRQDPCLVIPEHSGLLQQKLE